MILIYYVIAILPLCFLDQFSYYPPLLSANWFIVYGDMIVSSLVVTGFLPYVGIFLNWFFNIFRGKKPSDMYFKRYKIIRKNATLVTICLIIFTYGFAMPILFLVGTICMFCQYILDKILVTYYYRQEVNHNDRLSRIVLQIHKYGPVLMLVCGASTIV